MRVQSRWRIGILVGNSPPESVAEDDWMSSVARYRVVVVGCALRHVAGEAWRQDACHLGKPLWSPLMSLQGLGRGRE